jgi:hypothetical protein
MKQKITKKQLTHWLSVIVIGIAMGFAIQFAVAWTEPTAAPPGGNLGAPINTGATAQTKSGGMNIMGSIGIGTVTPQARLDVNGSVKLGLDTVCNINKKGAMAYNSDKLQYCNGAEWQNISSSASKLKTGGCSSSWYPPHGLGSAWGTGYSYCTNFWGGNEAESCGGACACAPPSYGCDNPYSFSCDCYTNVE